MKAIVRCLESVLVEGESCFKEGEIYEIESHHIKGKYRLIAVDEAGNDHEIAEIESGDTLLDFLHDEWFREHFECFLSPEEWGKLQDMNEDEK